MAALQIVIFNKTYGNSFSNALPLKNLINYKFTQNVLTANLKKKNVVILENNKKLKKCWNGMGP